MLMWLANLNFAATASEAPDVPSSRKIGGFIANTGDIMGRDK